MSGQEQTSPKRFGPYIILDHIADGGMAEIFLAKRQGYSGFEKVVALKKILPHYSEKPAFAEMLIHEAKLAAKLQHFNVVQVLDLGAVDSQVYIAMEYVHGRDLAAVLSNNHRRKERLPVEISLCIATEFLTGLDYAHRLQDSEMNQIGLIHRDISPQNILLSYEGEVKVTDFGIARAFSPNTDKSATGAMHGKFGYMSPEQILKREIDQRADIFSAGVVIHELLTGKRLYRGKNPKESAEMILNKVVPTPSAINEDVSSEIDTIVAKALHPDREQRYQTIGSLLGDLARTAEQLPHRASRRDLAVYMRRQFGTNAPRTRPSDPARPLAPEGHRISLVSNFSATSGKRTPVGDILISKEVITISQLDIALAQQRARGGRIGEILIETGVISERSLAEALAEQIEFPLLEVGKLLQVEPEPVVFKLFPLEAAKSMCVFPMSVNSKESKAVLAIADPFDERSLLEAKVILGVSQLDVFLTTREEIREATALWYVQATSDISDSIDISLVPEASSEELSRDFSEIPFILIADSDAETSENLRSRLQDEEWEILVVHSGKDAKKVCEDRSITAAFIETNLPEIDGYNLLLQIRNKDPHAAVYLTSSRADDFHQAKALDLGADDFLVKPLNIEVTAAKLRREVKRRENAAQITRTILPGFAGVSGSLEDMTFVDIIQSIELAKKTAVVAIQYDDGRTGEVIMIKGRVRCVIAIGMSETDGEENFHLLAGPGNGAFRIEYRESERPANINNNNTALLLEAIRRAEATSKPADSDEWIREEKTPPLKVQSLSSDVPTTSPPAASYTEGLKAKDLLEKSEEPAYADSGPALSEELPTIELQSRLLQKLSQEMASDVDDSHVFTWAPVVQDDSSLIPSPETQKPEPTEEAIFELDILEPTGPETLKSKQDDEPNEEKATVMAFDVALLKEELAAEETTENEPPLEIESLSNSSSTDFESSATGENENLIIEEPLTSVPAVDPSLLFEEPSAVKSGTDNEKLGNRREDRKGPDQPLPPKHFTNSESDLFRLPDLPGAASVASEQLDAPSVIQATKSDEAQRETTEPLPLPLEALTEVKPDQENEPIRRAPPARRQSEGQQLARVALQKKAVSRKDSKFGNAAVEKVAVKHVDHSRKSVSESAWPAAGSSSATEDEDNSGEIVLSIDDIVVDD